MSNPQTIICTGENRIELPEGDSAAVRAKAEEVAKDGDSVLYGWAGQIYTELMLEAIARLAVPCHVVSCDDLDVHPKTPQDPRIREIPTVCVKVGSAWRIYQGIDGCLAWLEEERGVEAKLVSTQLFLKEVP